MTDTHPDFIKAWTKAVDEGLIKGDPAYYYNNEASQQEVNHALITALLEVNGTPWDTVEPQPEPEPEPEPGTPAFGTRPTASGTVRPASGTIVENLYFNGPTNDTFIYRSGKPSNSHVCILTNGQNITIRDCDFEDVSQPVAVIGGGSVTIENCRVKGIVGPGSRVNQQTGNFVQTVNSPSNVRILNNVVIASTTFDPWNGQYETMTEDIISLFSAYDSLVEGNYLEATGYTRDYGTGIIAGDSHGDNAVIRNNTLVNPGQVGIAVAGGSGHLVEGNIIFRAGDENPGSGNTAAYCWDYNGGTPTDNVTFRNNRARYINGGGFWNPGPPPAAQSGNNWNDTSLTYEGLRRTV